MMQPKSRKERVAEYGSFLFCPKKDTICSELDNEDGICRRSPCLHDDVKWLAKQEEIRQNIEANAEKERQRREEERDEKTAPIRRQTKTKTELLEEQIKRKEEKARCLYRANKPKAAENVMREVMALRGRLRKMKGA